jgi:lysophospholipase L1-like esterase
MMVDALLGAVYPERMIRVINMGVSGNTTRDLKARWQRDVLDLKPDWLSIMIGANDVWRRQYDSPKQTESHVLIDEYERNLRELVSSTQPLVKGLILMTPYYIEPNRQDAMRATMDRYGAVVKKVAAATAGSVFVDVQSAFESTRFGTPPESRKRAHRRRCSSRNVRRPTDYSDRGESDHR